MTYGHPLKMGWGSGSDRSQVYSKEFTWLNQRANFLVFKINNLVHLVGVVILSVEPSLFLSGCPASNINEMNSN